MKTFFKACAQRLTLRDSSVRRRLFASSLLWLPIVAVVGSGGLLGLSQTNDRLKTLSTIQVVALEQIEATLTAFVAQASRV